MNIRSFPDTRGWSMISSTNRLTALRTSGLFHRPPTFAHGELELANGRVEDKPGVHSDNNTNG
jgi:hypothetical protein